MYIHCSIQQSTSHCCSLFCHWYIAIYLISGLKLSRSRSQSSVYTGQICDEDCDKDHNLDNFAVCKQSLWCGALAWAYLALHLLQGLVARLFQQLLEQLHIEGQLLLHLARLLLQLDAHVLVQHLPRLQLLTALLLQRLRLLQLTDVRLLLLQRERITLI